MTIFKLIMPILAFGFLSIGNFHNHDLCEGIVEKNDLWIEDFGALNNTGITEEDFHAIIDEFEVLYSDVFAEKGANLSISRKWDDGTVNAYASRNGNTWIVSMFGGLARHETITQDGFALVVCHEIGHHIGGFPRKSWGWASNEGQADYWGNLKCMRRYLEGKDHAAYLADKVVDEFAEAQCAQFYDDEQAQLECLRMALAGESLAKLFQALRKESRVPQFNEPDANEVSYTNHNHPATQCRMDTYFAGGLCTADPSKEVGDDDESVGTCIQQVHEAGFRPRCWFKPAE